MNVIDLESITNPEQIYPRIALLATENVLERREMNWNPYKTGYLAKSSRGYFFAYETFNPEVGEIRWVLQYEAETAVYAERGSNTGNMKGYRSLEDAQKAGQKITEAHDIALFGQQYLSRKRFSLY